MELKDSDNTFWNSARKYDLENKLRSLGRNLAIQSEQCGPKVSGNIYQMTEHALFVFDIFDIDAQRYLSPVDRRRITAELGLFNAPTLSHNFIFTTEDCNKILEMADGFSVLGTINTLREGLVFKANCDERISFKSVSNKYLCLQK